MPRVRVVLEDDNSQFAHFWSEIKDLNKASFCGYSLPHEDTKL